MTDFIRKFFNSIKKKEKVKQQVLVFIPHLFVLLESMENKKGSPLDEEEVIEIRDKAGRIFMDRSDAEKLTSMRAYPNIDPENVWEDWKMARESI